jgi:hypothetical protein
MTGFGTLLARSDEYIPLPGALSIDDARALAQELNKHIADLLTLQAKKSG